VGISLSFL